MNKDLYGPFYVERRNNMSNKELPDYENKIFVMSKYGPVELKTLVIKGAVYRYEDMIRIFEKQIPKKPLRGYTCKANNDSWRSCPVCHARQWNTHKYCSQCGQALDWSK